MSQIEVPQVHIEEGRRQAFKAVMVDRVGRVDAWNRHAASILGWREEDVLGKPFPVIDRSGASCPLGSLVRDRFQQPRSLHVRLDSVKRFEEDAVATLIVLDAVDP